MKRKFFESSGKKSSNNLRSFLVTHIYCSKQFKWIYIVTISVIIYHYNLRLSFRSYLRDKNKIIQIKTILSEFVLLSLKKKMKIRIFIYDSLSLSSHSPLFTFHLPRLVLSLSMSRGIYRLWINNVLNYFSRRNASHLLLCLTARCDPVVYQQNR